MKRLFALIPLLVFCLLCAPGVLAETASNVSYLDETGKQRICPTATVVAADVTTWTGTTEAPGWYVVTDTVEIPRRVTVTGDVPAHSMPGDSDFVQTLLKVYEDYTGNKGETMSMGGLTYVHGIPGGVAFGCGFPGTEYKGHEPDERMPLGELLLSGAMFAQVIADICG